MNKSPFKLLIESGVSIHSNSSQRRSIVFANYISLVLSGASILLFLIVPQNRNTGGLIEALISIIIFSVPIALNRLSFIILSRIYLCWIPPLLVTWAMILGMREIHVVPSSSYSGLRMYLVASSCIPYLLLDKRDTLLFIFCILPNLLILLFCDYFLNLAGVGYLIKGSTDIGYDFIFARSLIAYLIIGGSCFSLRFIVDKSDALNEKLLHELAEKNRVIKEQAESEVLQLNDRLKVNLQRLSEREFILNRSHQIAKIGSWEYRIENAFLFWSDEMYNIFGLDKNFDIKTGNIEEALGKEGNKQMSDATISLLRTGLPYDITIRTRTPLGYVKWFRIYAYPIHENDHIVGVRGICHDITYYKEAEEILKTSENNYRSLFEQASDFIMVIDFQGNFLDVNESLCHEFGYTKHELTRMKIETLIDPNQLKETPIRYAELDRGDHVLSDRRMMRRDGTIIEVEANVKKVHENKMLVIARNVTRLREVQHQIEVSEAKFRSAFEFSAIGMALVSLEGNWMKVNRELCKIVGYTEEELLSLKFQSITHPDDLKTDNELFHQAMQGEIGTYQREKRYFHKSGALRWVNVSVSLVRNNQGEPLYFISQIENISDKKSAELERERAHYLLNERIKELTTLYRFGQILQNKNRGVDEVLKELVMILPPGWQYPEITAARIVIGGREFKTPNFSQGVSKQRAEFNLPKECTGTIEIVYLEEKPSESEGPFLAEERDLINMIAEMLRTYFVRRHESEELRKSEANLNSTINNTTILIWSVDRNLNLLAFNKPFFNHMKKYYGVELELGSRILTGATGESIDKLDNTWEDLYRLSLNGEIVTLTESQFGIDFYSSLSPIVEDDGQIVGVSVFAEDVTEDKLRMKELTEAQKKIGELKLMALRSVMNPHFIFNVLNSIQFYIVGNDRLNAINYLSTFSKLIRSILTHSVDNKIKLEDEIEMLKNYVQLEILRFENKFSFKLEVEENLEVNGIEIPSLLVQPYVENAILHGLYNKEGVGTLWLRIKEQGDAIVFEIEDDGVGREAALKLRQKNFPSHKSMGIKLTEERLKLINELHNVSFEVEDLKEGLVPKGTRVTIWVRT